MATSNLLNLASLHVNSIVKEIFDWDPFSSQKMLIVYDEGSPLTLLISQAYQKACPKALVINFSQTNPQQVVKTLESLNHGDLVALIQSTSFRLDAFRIRIRLFERGLKVIEHPHLGRVREEEYKTYIQALKYEGPYFQHQGRKLKRLLENASEASLHKGDYALVYGGAFEPPKLNIGDYKGMKNAGGQFPIGEVFTELKDLTHLNGAIPLFAFGAKDFSVSNCSIPLIIEVKQGRVVGTQNSPPLFEEILNDIRSHEGDVWVRELGFGLNRAMNQIDRVCHDVGIYERMCGIHLSLGGKHALYPKKGFEKKKVKYHVDVFVDVDRVDIDKKPVYENGAYLE